MRLDVGVGPRCPFCSFLAWCPAADSDLACRSRRTRRTHGGLNTWHPLHPDFAALAAEVGGPQFDEVKGGPVDLAVKTPFAPQIRVRTALRRRLKGSAYSVSAYTAIGKRGKVLQAARLREWVDLRGDQQLVLQLFGQDHVLERLWWERHELLPQLAAAGFDYIVAPSYSTWMPRPPSEHMINHKRSLLVFQALQALGARVVPRVAFAFGGDVKRHGRWLQANSSVTAVGVDLGTYRSRRSWLEQLRFLAAFDDLTERRLSYWIHGPSTFERFLELFTAVPPRRVTISNARAIAAAGDFRASEIETRKLIALAAEMAAVAGGAPTPSRRERQAPGVSRGRQASKRGGR